MFSLTQKSMVKKRVQFQDQLVTNVTVFPMFHCTGKVDALVIVDHDRGKVYGLHWSKGLVCKPWFRPLRIARKFANLEELSVEKSYDMTRYWHFDPWWLLAESPFDRQKTTPALKSTNCVNELENDEINQALFARDLSKLDYWSYPNGDTPGFIGPSDRVLRPKERTEAPLDVLREVKQGQRGGWRLRPFWEKSIR
jgi:hypothetical protein